MGCARLSENSEQGKKYEVQVPGKLVSGSMWETEDLSVLTYNIYNKRDDI